MARPLFILCLVAVPLFSQEYSKAIEDNSFAIEEAYNQEECVVQHIITFAPSNPPSDFDAGFTQEWPLFGRTHQFSVSIPFVSTHSPEGRGFGDVLLNYRYQAIDEPGLAFSPRLSLVLPSGDASKGYGFGTTGMQINLPLSTRINNAFVTHANAGLTLLPNAAVGNSTATYSDYFIGGSAIYLAGERFNVLIELLYTNEGSPFGRDSRLSLLPGMRWAVDIGDLQIVPGLAFPFSVMNGITSDGIFLYLSFEHPY